MLIFFQKALLHYVKILETTLQIENHMTNISGIAGSSPLPSLETATQQESFVFFFTPKNNRIKRRCLFVEGERQ